jgi:hypothetical protein
VQAGGTRTCRRAYSSSRSRTFSLGGFHQHSPARRLVHPVPLVKQLQQGQISFAQALRDVVKIGEAGTADWWSARPIIAPSGRALDGPWPWQAFYWEAKAPSKKPTDVQLEWMATRRQCGFEASMVQISFCLKTGRRRWSRRGSQTCSKCGSTVTSRGGSNSRYGIRSSSSIPAPACWADL